MIHRMSHLRAPFLALLTVTGSSCVAVVAGAGVGYVISQEVLPNEVHTAEVRDDAGHVWALSRETLEILADPGTNVELADSGRSAKAKVNGATVTLDVEAYDLDRTLIRVQAEKYLSSDGRTAEEVISSVLDHLDKNAEAVPASSPR